jgi:hypothetical protein
MVTVLLAAVFTAVAVAAAGAADAPCQAAPYRAFDFWLGTWEVTLADGTRAGRNVIRSEQQGCVLVERWTGARGSTGTSMNLYDPVAGAWRQLWVSPQTQIDISGGRRGDSMVLEGSITYLADGRRHPFRGTWTLQDDGRVRQFFEEAREPGNWTPWFEGFYAPVDTAAGGREPSAGRGPAAVAEGSSAPGVPMGWNELP